jgi:hypothetical protein
MQEHKQDIMLNQEHIELHQGFYDVGGKERVLSTCDALTTDAELQSGLRVGLSGELKGDSLSKILMFPGAIVGTNGSTVGTAVLPKKGPDDGICNAGNERPVGKALG